MFYYCIHSFTKAGLSQIIRYAFAVLVLISLSSPSWATSWQLVKSNKPIKVMYPLSYGYYTLSQGVIPNHSLVHIPEETQAHWRYQNKDYFIKSTQSRLIRLSNEIFRHRQLVAFKVSTDMPPIQDLDQKIPPFHITSAFHKLIVRFLRHQSRDLNFNMLAHLPSAIQMHETHKIQILDPLPDQILRFNKLPAFVRIKWQGPDLAPYSVWLWRKGPRPQQPTFTTQSHEANIQVNDEGSYFLVIEDEEGHHSRVRHFEIDVISLEDFAKIRGQKDLALKIIAPPHDSVMFDPKVTFMWAAQKRFKYYHVFIERLSDNKIFQIKTRQPNITQHLSPGQYQWRVIAYNDSEPLAETGPQSLQIGDQHPLPNLGHIIMTQPIPTH